MRRHLSITGRVQGVGYRDGFAAQARALDLAGWVRNRTDGSVEAVVEGTPDAMKTITTYARRGPPAARVADVAVGDAPAEPNSEPLAGFVRRATA
ncbi:acylphosphatase [Sphingomonas sp. Leaf231]|uniref:acylphosphatase n=1 Tax=Sphingomonas sp. Leaf231 TaxID=1736301 RepID=UPI0006FF6B34|nr:acylphosphatase [Sphingomonas sp. Leaf231]KQN92407.1 acylphosphatase [Sphingomonas sp. Leaf231]